MNKENSLFQRMSEVAYKYNYVIDYLRGEHEYMVSDTDQESRNELIRYVGRVFRAFIKCTPEEKEILNRDFLGEVKPKGWWKKKYSEEAYQNLAFQAVTHFFRYFDDDQC